MTTPLPFQAGGTLTRSAVYVTRPEDEHFITAALRPHAWINITGCRMMGKSSLYFKHLDTLAAKGVDSVFIDIRAQLDEHHKTVHDWVRQLCEVIAAELQLDHSVISAVLPHIPQDATAGTLLVSLLEAVLQVSSRRLLLILDEYDCIAELQFCEDILVALRHVQELQNRSAKVQDLSLCLVGWKRIYQLGKPGSRGKSLACEHIHISDFDASPATFAALRQGFPPDSQPSDAMLQKVLDLSGGQPIITIVLLKEILSSRCQTPDDVRRIAFQLVPPSGIGSDDLQIFDSIDDDLTDLGDDAFEALHAYDLLWRSGSQSSTTLGAQLLLLYGLAKKVQEKLEIKGELFRRRFDDVWVENALSRVARSPKLQQHRGASKSSGSKRLCVINTGGTLGMIQRGSKVVAPRDEDEFKAYFSSLRTIAKTIEFHNLFKARDSINVFPDQWIMLAEYIYLRRHDGFDGFVVAHGTDTMAYTASAVAFALGRHLNFPVVFTGAQTTPDVAYGDAHVNLYRACEVAKQKIPEVVISFGNFVYRAVRAQKKDDRRFDGFESPTYPPLAEITGEINVRHELIRRLPKIPHDIILKADFEHSILIVPQFPGLEPEFFDRLLISEDERLNCRGVIVQTLGAGNVTNLKPYSFIPFVKRAHDLGIPVIVTSQYPPDPGTHTKYTPAQAPIKAGAIHAGNMTLAAAVTKFRWVMAQVRARRDWHAMTPADKRALVETLMVERSVVGEF